MTAAAVTLIVGFLLVLLACVKPLGLYMANVFDGRPVWALRAGAPLERWTYRLCGIDPQREMGWQQYAVGLLVFNAIGALTVYALQRLQVWLPLNPQKFTNVTPDSAFNTAVSFITNTNWQGYSGESTMSYLTQMAGLAVQNFLSAASGMVVAIALIRGLARHSASTIGNLWVDLTRSTLYVLLPLAAVVALALVSQGVIQNFSPYQDVNTVEELTYQQPKTDAAGNPRQGRCRQSRSGDAHHPRANSSHGADRLPGEHQGARHQWRRIPQRQFRTPVRESDGALEPAGDTVDPGDSRRAHLYLRPSRR